MNSEATVAAAPFYSHRVTLIHGAPARTEEYDCYIVEVLDRNRLRVRLRSGGVLCVGKQQVVSIAPGADANELAKIADLKGAFAKAHREATRAAWELFAATPVGPERVLAHNIYETIRCATRVQQ